MNEYHWTFCVDKKGNRSAFFFYRSFSSLQTGVIQHTLSECGSKHARATRFLNIRCLHIGKPDCGSTLSPTFLDGMTEASEAISAMAGLQELELDCLRYLLDYDVLRRILRWWNKKSALLLRKLRLVVSDTLGGTVRQ